MGSSRTAAVAIAVAAFSVSAIGLSTSVSATETVSYTYDALGRLTGSSASTGPTSGTAAAIQYDPAGNRLNYSVTGANGSAPVEGVIVVPLNGFTIIPILAAHNAGQPATPPSGISFSVSGPGTIQEGDAAIFTISKSAPTNVDLTIVYATANGTAVAPGDYVADSKTLTFRSWETSKIVSIETLVDTISEAAETFSLNLSSPSSGSTIGTGTAAATIAANTVNLPPNAVGDTLSLQICTSATKDVLANDTDPEGNYPLTLFSVSTTSTLISAAVMGGQVHVAAGGTTGTAVVQYVVKDSLGASATGNLNVTITNGSGCL